MAVGNVVAEDEEAHGDVVVGGGERTAAVLHAQDLEVVDDAVGDGLAAVGAVAAFDGELLFCKGPTSVPRCRVSLFGGAS